MRATEELIRRESSILFQLRSGHAPLNVHLHRIGCVDSPVCDACDGAIETVDYFLYDCATYNTQRRQLLTSLGARWRDRTYLLGDEKGIDSTLAYVQATGRWRSGAREGEEDVLRGDDGVE